MKRNNNVMATLSLETGIVALLFNHRGGRGMTTGAIMARSSYMVKMHDVNPEYFLGVFRRMLKRDIVKQSASHPGRYVLSPNHRRLCRLSARKASLI